MTPDRAVLVGALLAALAYLQDMRYDFILDDVQLILINPRIRSWSNWKSLFVTDLFEVRHPRAAMELGGLLYRPVYRLWQMLNAQLFGFVFPWWHITSLLLHVAVVFLVYGLGVRLLNHRWTAALAALLFAFHPIHAESVAYVTASTDLLVTLFALLSFLAYSRFREERGAPVSYLGAILAAALAMLSKETAVMYPWLLVAYEALRETTPDPSVGAVQRWKGLVWTLPFFAVVGAYAAVRTLLFGFGAGAGPGGTRLAGLSDIPLVLVVYLRNLFWPFRLSFFYPAEWGSQWTLLRGLAVVAILGTVALLWKRFRDRPGLRVQLVWAVILPLPALLAVFTFVRENWVHDRHAYFMSVPVCLIAAVLLTDQKWPRKYSIIASAGVLTAFLISLAIQLPRFENDLTIYSSALKVAPRSFLARSYYAESLWSFGHWDEGLREFNTVTELSPHSARAHERYGAALAEVGRDNDASAEYSEALRWSPGATEFRAFLLSEIAEVELRQSKLPEASRHLQEAIQIAPDALSYHALLAQALTGQGRTEEASQEMRLEAGVRKQAAKEQISLRYTPGL